MNVTSLNGVPYIVRPVYVEMRNRITILFDEVIAFFRDMFAFVKAFPSKLMTAFRVNPYPEYCDPWIPPTWRTNSTALHLLVHGFRGHPSIWNNYIERLRQIVLGADIKAPFVPDRGNCALTDATDPCRHMVRMYIRDRVNRGAQQVNIHLYGVSNGSRIALNIADTLFTPDLSVLLRNRGVHVSIRVHCIAGILRGTTHWQIRLANYSSFTRWLAQHVFRVSPEILRDFRYNNQQSLDLLQRMREKENTEQVDYAFNFYASTEDKAVIPFQSSLPAELGTHTLVHGHGHESIVDGVLNRVLA